MSNDRFKFRYYYITEKRYLKNSEIQAIAGMSMIEQKANDSAEVEQALCAEITGEIITEQCTGLRDKNGRLIYEGDIVSFQSRGLFFKGIVVWTQEEVPGEINLGGFGIRLPEDQEYEFMDYSRDRDSLEVVGNVHEDEREGGL